MNDKVEAKAPVNIDKDPDTALKVRLAHQIQHFFQYRHKGKWVSEKELMKKDRLYESVFNELVSKGLIEKKKVAVYYQYRWAVQYP